MAYMFEVYYKAPANGTKEEALTEQVSRYGGRLDYREEPVEADSQAVVLTYEFDEAERAEEVAELLRQQGEHVEGPVGYGP